MSPALELFITITAAAASVCLAIVALTGGEYPLPPEPREIGYGVVEGRLPTMPYPAPGAGTVWNETEEDR